MIPLPILIGGGAFAVFATPPEWLRNSSHSRVDMMLVIWFVLRGRGWGEAAIRAAIANAIGESNLNPEAVGDGGHAIGLFQLNDARPTAAGYGIPAWIRKNPIANTWRIADVAAQSPPPMGWFSDDVHGLIDWFCREVERPAHPDTDVARRIDLAERYLGL